jgi:hypothetical protein
MGEALHIAVEDPGAVVVSGKAITVSEVTAAFKRVLAAVPDQQAGAFPWASLQEVADCVIRAAKNDERGGYEITVGRMSPAQVRAVSVAWPDGDMGEGLWVMTAGSVARFRAPYVITTLSMGEAFGRALDRFPKAGFPYGALLSAGIKAEKTVRKSDRRRERSDHSRAP